MGAFLGSSPRVRGKQDARQRALQSGGLIPACAGKTPSLRPGANHLGAHPRVCGENCPRAVPVAHELGSSPRVRGKLAENGLVGNVGRLIPACAGKTSERSSSSHPKRAHPRVCGENSLIVLLVAVLPGSSPRVRGKLRLGLPVVAMNGLIPACAGKTITPIFIFAYSRAHPRVCGENGIPKMRAI